MRTTEPSLHTPKKASSSTSGGRGLLPFRGSLSSSPRASREPEDVARLGEQLGVEKPSGRLLRLRPTAALAVGDEINDELREAPMLTLGVPAGGTGLTGTAEGLGRHGRPHAARLSRSTPVSVAPPLHE
jgi:hypothetical protein